MALAAYREELWRAWKRIAEPILEEQPPQPTVLRQKSQEGQFDGGRTTRWMDGLGVRATLRTVRDRRTGHTIHVVSDRPSSALTGDVRRGLRLMAWMSQRPLVWYWWDQPWIRELPGNTDPEREHVNGGWAVPGILEVHVYRREEAHKVLLHETIHALGLDVPAAAVAPVRESLEAELGRGLWPHVGEAFTELFAAFLWSIARTHTLAAAQKAWDQQQACSATQAAQVWARIQDATANENTNVFAYYILKWVLMGHAAEVLLNPDRSVRHWIRWWRQKRPLLTDAAARAAHTEKQKILMGMTCPKDYS